ncbi:MAG: DNA sulfur modification protein DndD [Nitrosopumilus sp.]|nr:DNA sulfur modification protein DndD [Nitrosopumilus sp.]
MIINKIFITDFGVYGGVNEFDFKTSPEKTIILCGGKNGAGKTTLFESMMLCFYGKDFDDAGLEKQYDKKILRSFHSNLDTHSVSSSCSISIEFEIAYDGKIQEYKITRTWQNNDGKVDEDLSIQKSDSQSNTFKELDVSIPARKNRHTEARFEEIDSIEKSEWQQFINQLIPRGIAKLFFFDGEKIQSIADEGNENKYIQSSFDTLLGLDLVTQLQKDIGFVLYRDAKKKKENEKRTEIKNDTMTQEKLKLEMLKKELIEFAELRNGYENYRKIHNKPQHLENYESMIRFATNEMRDREFNGSELQSLLFLQDILKEKLKTLELNIAEKNNSIKSTHDEFLLATERFEKIGGNYYEKNKEMEKNESEMTSKIAVTEKQISDLCAGELPFCLVPEQLDEVKKQIQSDQKVILLNYEKEIFEKNNETISSALQSKSFLPDISMDVKKLINSELVKFLKEELDEKSTSEILFNLSSMQMEKILTLIENSKELTIQTIEKLTNSYAIQKRALEKFAVVGKIKPEIEEIKSIMSERDSFRDQERDLKVKLEQLESDLAQNNSRLKMLNSKIRTSLDRQNSSEKLSSSDTMAQSVLEVLDDYSQSLRNDKISLLESNVLRGLDILLHKKDFIKKVTIDKESFAVKLYNGNGDEITKNMLSKGELQIYATALVWGLAKTSGRPLPFMIDTPLARLDVDHRSTVVESFFPETSQQTIILSTDSEIDLHYYSKLKPYISKSYTITFDSSKGKTKIHEGYFFDNEEMTVEVQ